MTNKRRLWLVCGALCLLASGWAANDLHRAITNDGSVPTVYAPPVEVVVGRGGSCPIGTPERVDHDQYVFWCGGPDGWTGVRSTARWNLIQRYPVATATAVPTATRTPSGLSIVSTPRPPGRP